MKWLFRLTEVVILMLLGVLLIPILMTGHPLEVPIRDHLVEHGVEETGAWNLVTAIYLGYRAWDTLGETVVLLLAVSGVVHLLGEER